jgi:hypothetical protein
LRQTETAETIPEGNIFLSEERLGASTRDALAAANDWLAQQNEAG